MSTNMEMRQPVVAHVETDGKCPHCDIQIKVGKSDHNFFRTKGYTKYYGEGKAIVRCPKCRNEIFVSLK